MDSAHIGTGERWKIRLSCSAATISTPKSRSTILIMCMGWDRTVAAIASPGIYPRSNNSNQALTIISYVANGLCLLLISIFVPLRLYARHKVWGSIDREDCKLYLPLVHRDIQGVERSR
jgi:hypothetical protein